MKLKQGIHILTAVLLAVLMAFAMMPVSAMAADGEPVRGNVDSGTCGDNLTWTLTDTGVLTISGTGAMYDWRTTDLPPWKYGDIDDTRVKSVIIESGVTTLGDYAFTHCKDMQSITFRSPSKVKKIGRGAFNLCRSMESIEIPDGVEEIGMNAFTNCIQLKEITLPGSIERILTDAFLFCDSLERVTISEGTECLVSNLFRNCPSLKYLSLPYSLNSIIDNPFANCSSLTNITFPNGNPYFTVVDGVLFNKDVTALLACPNTKETYSIPSSVTSIGKSAFYSCTSLKNITIPSGVTSIGAFAFEGCVSLLEIELPAGLTAIEGRVFDDCRSLTSFTIPSGVTSIGDNAFNDCSSLQSIEIPSSVTSIGPAAFIGCKSLQSITIPDKVTAVNSSTFGGCESLTTLTIPANVTEVGETPFYNCTNLGSITFTGSAPSFDKYAFKYCGASVYYPAADDSWTDSVLQNYGGTITWVPIIVDLSDCSIEGVSAQTYTGGELEPEPTVTLYGKTLIKDKHYSISYENNVNAGTATMIITGIGGYTGTASAAFEINKAANPLAVKGKTVKVKYKKIKKKAKTLSAASVIAFANKGQGAITYTKASGNKKITIASNGSVKIKKKLKKGKYTVKVNVTASGSANYNPVTKPVTFVIKVK